MNPSLYPVQVYADKEPIEKVSIVVLKHRAYSNAHHKALRIALNGGMPEKDATISARAAGKGATAGVPDPDAPDIDIE